MFGVKSRIKQNYLKYRWRKLNRHNYTNAVSLFNCDRVKVGNKTYGDLNINLGTNPDRSIEIGNFCSIAPNVQFIINSHNYRFFSSWGWQIYEYDERWYEWEKKTRITVEDDVWIGQGAIILGGAVLRQGCVIGAGTVVSCEVPPYAIYVGNRIVRYRFEEDVCKKLEKIDYSKFDRDIINAIKGWHKVEINSSNVDEFLSLVPHKDN